MPIPSTLPTAMQPPLTQKEECGVASRWNVSYELIHRMVHMSQKLPWQFQIISGARSEESQQSLRQQGRPAASFDRSTHADRNVDGSKRFATGVDIRALIFVTPTMKRHLMYLSRISGLRMGGGSPVNRTGIEQGIPSDWNHFDLGPRN